MIGILLMKLTEIEFSASLGKLFITLKLGLPSFFKEMNSTKIRSQTAKNNLNMNKLKSANFVLFQLLPIRNQTTGYRGNMIFMKG